MNDLAIRLKALIHKARTMRTDVADLAALRKVSAPTDGAAFLVERRLFIWVASDRTPDDGVFSIRPDSIPASDAGRFRRAVPRPRD